MHKTALGITSVLFSGSPQFCSSDGQHVELNEQVAKLNLAREGLILGIQFRGKLAYAA